MTALVDGLSRRLKTLESKVGRIASSVTGASQAWVSAQFASFAAGLRATPWVPFAYGSGWSDHSAGNQPGGSILNAVGRVCLRGLVKRSTAGIGAGNPIATLPPTHWPSNTVTLWTGCGGTAGSAKIVITTSGSLYIEQAPGVTSPESIVWLDGLSFDPRP